MTILFPGLASKIFGLIGAIILLITCILASILLGVVDTSWITLFETYTHFNGSNEHIVIQDVRVPRAFIAAAVGSSLGICGVLLQALTRNPLADTGIFGINGGAALFVVLAVSFLNVSALSQYVWVAFLGAAASGLLVFFLGSLGFTGLNPVRLALAGAAIAAMSGSFTHAILILDDKALQEVLFWLAGSVEGRNLDILLSILPFMIPCWIGAMIIAGPLNTLLLGDDVATGLGQRTAAVKVGAGLLVIILAGSSVAVAGPIGFIGLTTPHIARLFVGMDQRWVVLYSAFLGAILLLLADLAARFIAMPQEVPVGVMTALIGTPFFVYAARRGFGR
jgi:iron complex transport system permease protein